MPAKTPAKTTTKPAQKVLRASKPHKKELSANNYVALVAVICVVVMLIAGFVANMTIRSIVTNSKVMLGKQRAVSELDTKLENGPKLIEAYKDLGPTQALIEHALPNKADFPQVVSIIESIGNASSVRVRSVTPAATTTAAAPSTAIPSAAPASSVGANEYAFSVTVDGGYTQVISFLKNLELSARPMKVTSVDFRGNSGNISADIQAVTYWQPATDINDKTEPVK